MEEQTMWCGPNDGGIKRGDRAETGGEEARPTGTPESWDPGEGLTGRSIGGEEDENYDQFDTPENRPSAGDDLGDLTILDADDPSLGLTNIGDKPGEDWAADTGPTHSNEEMDESSKL